MKLKFNDSDKEILETAAANEVYEVAKELNKKMTEFAEQRDAKELEAKAAKDEAEKIKKDSEAIAADLEKVKKELEKINEVRAQEKIQADFSARMADLNEKFELDEVKSKSIAADIRGLDDTAFAAWQEKMKPFLVAKKMLMKEDEMMDEEDDMMDDEDDKKAKKARAKKDKECKASTSIEDQLADIQPFGKKVVNKVSEGQKSVEDLFNEAFGDLTKDKKDE